MLNQEKDHLKTLALFPPQHGCGLTDSSLPSQYRTLVPGSRGSRADFIHKLLCLAVLKLLGDSRRTDARHSSLLLNSELTKSGKAAGGDQKHYKVNKTCSHPEQKIIFETYNKLPKLGENLGERFFRIIRHLKSPHACLGQIVRSEKIRKDLKLPPQDDL